MFSYHPQSSYCINWYFEKAYRIFPSQRRGYFCFDLLFEQTVYQLMIDSQSEKCHLVWHKTVALTIVNVFKNTCSLINDESSSGMCCNENKWVLVRCLQRSSGTNSREKLLPLYMLYNLQGSAILEIKRRITTGKNGRNLYVYWSNVHENTQSMNDFNRKSKGSCYETFVTQFFPIF